MTQLVRNQFSQRGSTGSLAFHCTASLRRVSLRERLPSSCRVANRMRLLSEGPSTWREKNRFHLSSGSEEVDGRPNLDHHRTMESTRKSSTVAVFSGGPTDEHPISIETGKALSGDSGVGSHPIERGHDRDLRWRVNGSEPLPLRMGSRPPWSTIQGCFRAAWAIW